MASKRNQAEVVYERQIPKIDAMLVLIDENSDRLNKWETEFFTSVSDQFYAEERRLTPAQIEKIEQIYAKFA